jgi:hypothetical protein
VRAPAIIVGPSAAPDSAVKFLVHSGEKNRYSRERISSAAFDVQRTRAKRLWPLRTSSVNQPAARLSPPSKKEWS